MTIGTDPIGTTAIAVTEGGFSVPPPAGVITTVAVDGQDVTVSGTTTGTPTGGMCTLTAGSGGAVSAGPAVLTFGSGTFSVVFPGVTPGSYSGEVVSLSNAGGSVSATGSSAFVIDPISGTPTAPDSGSATHYPATILSAGKLATIPAAQLGTGKKPVVYLSGRLRQRATTEGTPIVFVNGRYRLLAAGETLDI